MFQLELKKQLSQLTTADDLDRIAARIQQKLTLCINPSTLIMPEVADLTGLDNYNLESQPTFSVQTAQVLLLLSHPEQYFLTNCWANYSPKFEE